MDFKALNAELGITLTIRDLDAVPGNVERTERDAVEKQIKLTGLRSSLAEAQAELERARIDASLQAIGENAIDGRNKEQRELQLAAYLTHDPVVTEATEQVRHLQRIIEEKEGELERVKVSVRRFNNELRTLCHIAALHTEILRILGGDHDH